MRAPQAFLSPRGPGEWTDPPPCVAPEPSPARREPGTANDDGAPTGMLGCESAGLGWPPNVQTLRAGLPRRLSRGVCAEAQNDESRRHVEDCSVALYSRSQCPDYIPSFVRSLRRSGRRASIIIGREDRDCRRALLHGARSNSTAPCWNTYKHRLLTIPPVRFGCTASRVVDRCQTRYRRQLCGCSRRKAGRCTDLFWSTGRFTAPGLTNRARPRSPSNRHGWTSKQRAALLASDASTSAARASWTHQGRGSTLPDRVAESNSPGRTVSEAEVTRSVARSGGRIHPPTCWPRIINSQKLLGSFSGRCLRLMSLYGSHRLRLSGRGMV